MGNAAACRLGARQQRRQRCRQVWVDGRSTQGSEVIYLQAAHARLVHHPPCFHDLFHTAFLRHIAFRAQGHKPCPGSMRQIYLRSEQQRLQFSGILHAPSAWRAEWRMHPLRRLAARLNRLTTEADAQLTRSRGRSAALGPAGPADAHDAQARAAAPAPAETRAAPQAGSSRTAAAGRRCGT